MWSFQFIRAKSEKLSVQEENVEILKRSSFSSESNTGCPKNGVLTVHYGVEETTVNVRKMFKKFYWT
jgi:hypothetical protein